MKPDKGLQLIYGLAIVLLCVGVLCYAAAPPPSPDPPVRVMFKGVGGKVLFDHKAHAADSGYGLACYDCHHHPDSDESALQACGSCHKPPTEDGSSPQACMECHEAEDIEDSQPVRRSEAFHTQCIECHENFGAGATECSACHFLQS